MKPILGIIPPITTPFTPAGDLALDRLTENLQKYMTFDLSGFLILGSNGEAVSMNTDEKMRVLETARKAIPPDRIMMAGTGCQSTRDTIHLCKEAAAAGADCVLVLNPSYYKGNLTVTALEQHYVKVAEASPLPVFIYNMPVATGIDLETGLIIRLSEHPNIIGIKDSSGNITKIGDVIKHTDPAFTVLSGSAGALLASLLLGAEGGIVAFANIAPQKCVDLYEWFHSGKLQNARQLQLEIIHLNTMVTRTHGVPALKAVMDMLGFYGGPPRSPLLPVDEALRIQLESALIEAGIKPI